MLDLDALARDVVDRFMRGDLSGPPLPPYMARWAEHERAESARMQAEYGAETAPDPEAFAWPPFESVGRVAEWHLGDLDVYLYRVEPTASALLLVLRGDALAYTSFAGYRFMGPLHDSETVPPYDLAAMATRARAQAELDFSIVGAHVQRDGPVGIAFEIEPERYTPLNDTERAALHAACVPVASDAALLFCGRSSPLVVVFKAPDPPQTGDVHVDQVGLPREALGQFEAP